MAKDKENGPTAEGVRAEGASGSPMGIGRYYRLARPGLFIAMSCASAATHSTWAFAAAFAFGLAGCLDAIA